MLHRKLLDLAFDAVDVFDAPDRTPVADVVAEHYKIEVPGVGLDYWQERDTPYMVEPLNECMSRQHTLLVFLGPARCGKSVALINGVIVYTVLNNPVDFAVIRSSKDNASIWSDTEFRRLHEENQEIGARLGSRAWDNSILKKRYRSGIVGLVSWPSSSVFAEKTIALMLLTDYGKWLANIGGHGSGLEQARKRTQTLGSSGMTIVESSPGSCWIDPMWKPGSAHSHELPPTDSGAYADIVPAYNGGDRRWWYVPCEDCGEFYPQSPELARFSWPDPDLHKDAAQQGGTVCVACGSIHGEDAKFQENTNGLWLRQGEAVDCYGKVSGQIDRPGTYPSFGLGGGAAAYQSRHEIIGKLIAAEQLREKTGAENDLQTVVNGDVGAPHKPALLGEIRQAHPLMARAEHYATPDIVDQFGRWLVPDDVRFLVAAVDIQKNRFVVQVHGYGINENGDRERWVIDRYNLRVSERLDPDNDDKPFDINPARYAEDWEVLTKLIGKSYPLADGSGRRMSLLTTLCDSGGGAGVTLRAYHYWRSLRDRDGKNLQNQFRLVKGSGLPTAKLVEETWPDTSGRRDRGASRGDIPVLRISTNMIKDRLAHDLDRDVPGEGYTHFPKWLKAWWFEELTREQKTPKGWTDMDKQEAWDLMVYSDAGALWGPFMMLKKAPLGLEQIKWDKPPPWAAEHEDNPYVFHPDDEDEQGSKHGGFSVSDWRA